MEYKCINCKYMSNRKSNYERHIATCNNFVEDDNTNTIDNNNITEHNETVDCKYCGNTYSRPGNLNKHKVKCIKKYDYEINIEHQLIHLQNVIVGKNKSIDEKNKLIETLQLSNQNLQKSFDEYRNNHLTYMNSLVRDSGTLVNNSLKTVNNSMNALSFINKHYSDAPQLEEPVEDDIFKEKNNKDFVETLIYNHQQNIVHKSIGNIYIELYQKEDPVEQAVWNSDVERLTFYIRLLVNNRLKWVPDKKGVDLGKLTVRPILNAIKKEINVYYNDNCSADKILNNPVRATEHLCLCNEIISMIDNGILESDVIKYISPHFDIKRQSLLQLEQPSNQSKDQVKVLPKDQAKDQVKDQAKDQAKDQVKDQAKDQVKDQVKDRAKDQVKDQAKDQVKDRAKDQAKDQVKDRAKDQVKDQVKDKSNKPNKINKKIIVKPKQIKTIEIEEID
jgi:hypothetical protein